LVVTAAPGHGYAYKWHLEGAEPPADFTQKATYDANLDPCETKTVHLEVQNMLGRTATESVTRCREVIPGCCKPVGAGGLSNADGGPGPLPPDRALRDLLQKRPDRPIEGGQR
jgi:hypothetical protein